MDTTLNGTLQGSVSRDKLDIMQPCFLFDHDKFMSNLRHFNMSFSSYFGDMFIPSYSTKTNSSPHVLSAVRESRDWKLEIVSPHELMLARQLKFPLRRIVYNGVIPDLEGKFAVAESGGIVNVENYSELKALADLAMEAETPIEVGLRVNIHIDDNRPWESRFGVKPYTEQFDQCLNLQSDYLKIVGIHSHIHGCRTLDFWRERATQLGIIAKDFWMSYIDFGSNMFGFMDERLAAQFPNAIPTADDYARTIHDGLVAVYGSNHIPTVIIEPGTPVVADTICVLGKVETINERGFDTIATASCSVYDFGFFHGSDKHPPMDVVHMSEGKHYEDLEIFGYACTEDDTVCKSYTGELAVGDYLLFRNLGAYANSLCSDFIKPSLKTYDIRTLRF